MKREKRGVPGDRSLSLGCKRACKQCEEQGVGVAPVAECILPKPLVSDQVIIDTVAAKYYDSLPLYRQSAIHKRDTGVDISRSTMDG